MYYSSKLFYFPHVILGQLYISACFYARLQDVFCQALAAYLMFFRQIK